MNKKPQIIPTRPRNLVRNGVPTLAAIAILLTSAVNGPARDPLAPTAERIIIKCTGGTTLELVSRTPLTKVLPPSDTLPQTSGQVCGFWYELRGATNQVLYRRAIANPIPDAVESADPISGKLKRFQLIPMEKLFSVLIPHPQDGDQLVIFCSPAEATRQTQPAHEAIRFTLKANAK